MPAARATAAMNKTGVLKMIGQTLFVHDPSDMESVKAELAAIRRMLEGVTISPRPEWITVADYAAMIGRSARTVKRMIEQGKVEAKHVGGVRMIRI